MYCISLTYQSHMQLAVQLPHTCPLRSSAQWRIQKNWERGGGGAPVRIDRKCTQRPERRHFESATARAPDNIEHFTDFSLAKMQQFVYKAVEFVADNRPQTTGGTSTCWRSRNTDIPCRGVPNSGFRLFGRIRIHYPDHYSAPTRIFGTSLVPWNPD